MKRMAHPGRCRLRRALSAVLFTVCGTAQASNTCTVEMTASVDFGNLAVLSGTAQHSEGSITVSCSGDDGDVSYMIGLDKGSGEGATEAVRRLQRSGAPTDQLSYSLYRSSSDRTAGTVWGNSGDARLPGSLTVTGSNGTKAHPVYGKVFGNQQTTRPGSYTGTVTITVTY